MTTLEHLDDFEFCKKLFKMSPVDFEKFIIEQVPPKTFKKLFRLTQNENSIFHTLFTEIAKRKVLILKYGVYCGRDRLVLNDMLKLVKIKKESVFDKFGKYIEK